MKEERKREIIQKKKINYLINLVSIYEKQFWYVIDYNMITFKIYYRMQSTAILHFVHFQNLLVILHLSFLQLSHTIQ